MINREGQVFGYLTVLLPIKAKYKPLRWLCRCICGTEVSISSSNLLNNSTKSCGCKKREMHNSAITQHGMSKTPEFRLWAKIKGFCYNSNHINYPQYGGRGIIMCERWLNSFDNFLTDIGKKPLESYTLYRINPNGNYEPLNCQWREIDRTTTNINLTKNLSRKRATLEGRQFNRLTVTSFSHLDKGKNAYWLCKCSCGNSCISLGKNLYNGNTQSCGCLHKELLIERATTHGGSGTRTYYIWNNMRERCSNSKNSHYHRYGGRGIKVCSRWLDFSNFITDIGKAPEGYSIERINNDGDYEPSNCKWIPRKKQAENKSTNRFIEYEDKRLYLTAWAKELKVSIGTLKYLLNHKKLTFPNAVSLIRNKKGKRYNYKNLS